MRLQSPPPQWDNSSTTIPIPSRPHLLVVLHSFWGPFSFKPPHLPSECFTLLTILLWILGFLLLQQNTMTSWVVVAAYVFNLSTQKAEAGKSLWVWGQPCLQNQFQDSQGVTQKNLVLKNQNKQTSKQTTDHDPKASWGGKVYLTYISTLFIITKGVRSRTNRTRSWRWELMQRPQRGAAYWLA